jgi:transaldolase / glucose-6-phosphate isomerase
MGCRSARGGCERVNDTGTVGGAGKGEARVGSALNRIVCVVGVQAHIPQGLQASVISAVERVGESHVAQRVREKDASLWGATGTPEVADRLGWVDVAKRVQEQLDGLEAFGGQLREEGCEHVVVLGMGGSSLAPEVLRRSLRSPAGAPRLHVLDSTDARAVRTLGETIDAQRTLFLVSSKSGGTIEPLSLLAHFWALVERRPGGTEAAGGGRASSGGRTGLQFAAITDPGTALEQLARERGFRHIFHGDPEIGGRYSALSPFGMVPAALAGFDVRALLGGSRAAWDDRVQLLSEDVEEMRGLPAPIWLGAALGALAREGRDKLTFVVPHPLDGLGLWEEQLLAESTGKQGTGILPVADEPLGEPGVYGEDRVFVYMPDASAPALGGPGREASEGATHAPGGPNAGEDPADQAHVRARVLALAEAGHPVFEIPLSGPLDLGRAFLLSELAVASAGWELQINPFDQPDVQRAKDATNRVLEGFEREGSLPEIADADAEELRALVADAEPPSYVAIMAYAQPSTPPPPGADRGTGGGAEGGSDFDAAVTQLRRTIRDGIHATTTFGYGPRYLHSTGQFHKGGPKTGRFLQLVHDGPEDVEIPGKPYTFTTLKNAQAIGDLQTLRELGLPVARVRLHGDDAAAALRALTDKIKEML